MYKPRGEKHSFWSLFFMILFPSFEIENYECINFVYTSDLTMCMFVKKKLTWNCYKLKIKEKLSLLFLILFVTSESNFIFYIIS